MSLGHTEILVIFALIVLIFGTRIPKVAKSLGQSITSFRQGLNEHSDAGKDAPEGVAAQRPAPDKQ